MKKLIFGLMAFMLLFFVVSCDNGTTNNNSDVSTETDPYEELEKSLTVKLSSIDEVEFSDGEWEYYFESFEPVPGCEEFREYKEIMTVDSNIITFQPIYTKGTFKYSDEEVYLERKEYYVDKDGYTFDDKNKEIIRYEDNLESYSENYDEFVSSLDTYFREDFIQEIDFGCITYTYLVKTNSKKDAFLFLWEVKDEDFEVPEESEVYFYKIIFKKIK